MNTMPQYIYHSEKARHYYGRYNATENDIVYDVKYETGTLKLLEDHTIHGSVSSDSSSGSSSSGTPGSSSGVPTPAVPVRNSSVQYSIQIPVFRRTTDAFHSHSMHHSHHYSYSGGIVNSFDYLFHHIDVMTESESIDSTGRHRHRSYVKEEEKLVAFLQHVESIAESLEGPFLMNEKDRHMMRHSSSQSSSSSSSHSGSRKRRSKR